MKENHSGLFRQPWNHLSTSENCLIRTLPLLGKTRKISHSCPLLKCQNLKDPSLWGTFWTWGYCFQFTCNIFQRNVSGKHWATEYHSQVVSALSYFGWSWVQITICRLDILVVFFVVFVVPPGKFCVYTLNNPWLHTSILFPVFHSLNCVHSYIQEMLLLAYFPKIIIYEYHPHQVIFR